MNSVLFWQLRYDNVSSPFVVGNIPITSFRNFVSVYNQSNVKSTFFFFCFLSFARY